MLRILPVLAACRSSPACTTRSRRRVCFPGPRVWVRVRRGGACREDGPGAGTGDGLRRAELALLRPGRRSGPVRVALDGTSTLRRPGGVAGGAADRSRPPSRSTAASAGPGTGPPHGDVVLCLSRVGGRSTCLSARFVLDVHLGTLARLLRLVGVDAAYANDASPMMRWPGRRTTSGGCCSPKTAACCTAAQLWQGAYVRGARPDEGAHGRAGPVRPAAGALDPVPQPATGRCPPRRRQTLILCCSPAPGAPTRRSPAARTAARCTGAARTAST